MLFSYRSSLFVRVFSDQQRVVVLQERRIRRNHLDCSNGSTVFEQLYFTQRTTEL